MSRPRPIRVMVVDDSVVVRQVIADALRKEAGIVIVGTAENGKVGLAKLDELAPDAIVLDLEMPELDGLGFLKALRKRASRPKVIMFSTLTERGASATMDALAHGADDYLCKPSGHGSLAATMERIRLELVPKLQGLAGSAGSPRRATSGPTQRRVEPTHPIGLIAIGSSTGGPTALADVLRGLRKDLRVPIVIAQHMPPVFTRVLAQRLTEKGPLKVLEAAEGDVLQAGHVYIAPGDFHLRVVRDTRGFAIRLNQGPRENGCRPAADVLFKSVAEVAGNAVLAIVLTGLGSDGTIGASAIRQAGGRVWVQDRKSSAAWGMPGSIAEAGLADRVLPLSEIAKAIDLAIPRSLEAVNTPPRVAKP